MQDDAISILQKKVRQIEIVSNRLVTDQLAGEYHSAFKGQGMEFEEVRPYIPGDEIRTIDWNVTARAGEAHIKRFREERELTVFLVVDVSASCRFGTRNEFKSELMAEVCAVLAFATIANQDRVGLLLCSDQVELILPPRKGKQHILRLVREVLGFKPKGNGTNLSLGLEQLRHVLNRKAVVFVLSDFLNVEFEAALSAVARRHDVIAISFDDPVENELPDVGLLDLIDAETGRTITVDTSERSYREFFKNRRDKGREERRKTLRRNEIDLIELINGVPYENELVRFFRWRVRRRSR